MIICSFNYSVNYITGNKGSRSIVNQYKPVIHSFKTFINGILPLLSAAQDGFCLMKSAAELLTMLQILL